MLTHPFGVADDSTGHAGVAAAFTTRRVPTSEFSQLLTGADLTPRAGDLVLVRIDEIGHHSRIQLPSGGRKFLFLGDEVILTYGNRYAPSQFEAIVPRSLEPCHLVAAGGVAAMALSWHERIRRGPTEVTPLGLVADAAGKRLNVADWALPSMTSIDPKGPVTIAVAGTAMNAGKTHTAAFFAKGLVNAGLKVGFAKVTGTGANGDPNIVRDAGVHPVLDFTDAGYASTYLVDQAEIEQVVTTLIGRIQQEDVDAIVVEVADGLFQEETASLLRSPFFRSVIDGIIFCAPDAMGASAGYEWLRRNRHHMLALSGVLTSAPLQTREAAAATSVPVLSRFELCDPVIATKLADDARLARQVR